MGREDRCPSKPVLGFGQRLDAEPVVRVHDVELPPQDSFDLL
jgi:hypothetical protein